MVTKRESSFFKGKWIFDLLTSIFNKSIDLRDAIDFFFARFRKKPLLSVNNIVFSNVDHTKWSLIWEIFLGKNYNPEGFEIAEDDLVVDIGAHKGVFVAYASQYTKNKILAFEPDKSNFNELEQLLKQNSINNVLSKNVAISSADEQIKFFTSGTSTRHSLLGIDLVTGEEFSEWIMVDAISISTALDQINIVDYLKMDCEGAEVEIIQNIPEKTLKKIKRIAMEYHDEVDSERFNILLNTLEKYYQKIIIQPAGQKNLGYIFASDLIHN